MTSRRVLPALALALLVAGCGTGGGTQAGRTGSPTAPGTTSSAPTTPRPATSTSATDHSGDGSNHAPPFPADLRPDTGRASVGSRGTITAIRVGHHDGFDRVVFEFHGTGTPGWTVRYVPQAQGQASGRPIDLPGTAVLSVAITGVGYPADTGIQEVAHGPVRVTGTDIVTEAYFESTFEGITQAFVGTTAQRPFRVYLLTGPARVVLEVREH